MKAGDAQAILAPDEIRLLAEIGYLACGAAHAKAANAIFEGLRILQPNRSFVYVGLALASLCSGAPRNAIFILREQGLARLPGNNELKVFLGLALSLANQARDSRRVLEEVAASSDAQAPEGRFARKLLEQLDAQAPGIMRLQQV